MLAFAWGTALGVAGCDAPTQAESCQRYVACIRALDERDGKETNVDRFDPGGACWNGEEQAHVCDQSCERGLEWLSDRYDDLPAECVP